MIGKLLTFEMIAIEEAEKMLRFGATDKEKVLARVAIPAIKKQIPKKPNYDGEGFPEYWYCPTCGEVVFSKIDGLTISDKYHHRHCGVCGQAIDWIGEEMRISENIKKYPKI